MPKLNPRGIKGNGARLCHHLLDLSGGDEQKVCLAIYKPGDQPWAGHAVNMYV
jgi:hypothetical protein